MDFIKFTEHSRHPLAETLTGKTGMVVARETRDGVPWLVAEFLDYGTVCLPIMAFKEVTPEEVEAELVQEIHADGVVTPEEQSMWAKLKAFLFQ
jgi:hypothetical protein